MHEETRVSEERGKLGRDGGDPSGVRMPKGRTQKANGNIPERFPATLEKFGRRYPWRYPIGHNEKTTPERRL